MSGVARKGCLLCRAAAAVCWPRAGVRGLASRSAAVAQSPDGTRHPGKNRARALKSPTPATVPGGGGMSHRLVEDEAMVERRFRAAAQSSMRIRKVISFSPENDLACSLAGRLADLYPEKNAVHVVDFSLTNALLTHHLLREKFPAVTSLDPFHIGNLYNCLPLHVPPLTCHQFAFEDFFSYTRLNFSPSLKLKSSFCKKYLHHLPPRISASIQSPSLAFQALAAADQTKVVAVGILPDAVRTIKHLLPYGKALFFRATQDPAAGHPGQVALKPAELVAYVPSLTAAHITAPKLGKLRREKLFLDMFTTHEVLDRPRPSRDFLLHYSPTAQFDLTLLHIRPRGKEDSLARLGLTADTAQNFELFFRHCAFSPARPFSRSLLSWSSDLDTCLTPEQARTCLKDCSLLQLADIYHALCRSDSFALLQHSWTRYLT